MTRDYLRPGMHVPEFGCGTGSTAIAHAPFVQHITAIDVSSRMLEVAKRKAEAERVSNVSFEQSTIDAFTGTTASHDPVLALSILHLVADRDEVIEKVHTLLKPDGEWFQNCADVYAASR